jgi:uncharacterized protein (TIGR02646 family)
MHKLERGEVPQCLSKFQHGLNTWDEVSSADREEIWGALDAMQGKRCAYCEADISKGKHIEHFRQQASHRYPQGTFDWTNLFGSCNSKESCGSHKDKIGAYRHEDLLKPDEEDPEAYLTFVVDGSIVPRFGLPEKDRHRALETLRIFNLDHERGPLRQMRKRAILGYLQTAEELRQWADTYPQEQWLPFLEEELARIMPLPFTTAIKHALTSRLETN